MSLVIPVGIGVMDRMRTGTVAIPATGALATCTVTVTWANGQQPYADLLYRVIPTFLGANGNLLQVQTQQSKSTTGVIFTVKNLSAVTALLAGQAFLDVVAIHD